MLLFFLVSSAMMYSIESIQDTEDITYHDVADVKSAFCTDDEWWFKVQWLGYRRRDRKRFSTVNLSDLRCEDKIFNYFKRRKAEVPREVKLHFDLQHTFDALSDTARPYIKKTSSAYNGFKNERHVGATHRHNGAWRPAPKEGHVFPRTTKSVYYEGRHYQMFCQEKFHKATPQYKCGKVTNCVQVIVEHLLGKKLPSEVIQATSIKQYFAVNTNLQLIELMMFNKAFVKKRNINYSRIAARKKRRNPNTQYRKNKMKCIDYWRCFERQSGVLVLICSIRKNSGMLHAAVLNLDQGFLYEGGELYIPFNKDQIPTKKQSLALLAKLNIADIQNIYLVANSNAGTSNNSETLYNGIDEI